MFRLGLCSRDQSRPSEPSGAAPKGAPCTCGEMIRSQNFFKKIVDFLLDTKVSLSNGGNVQETFLLRCFWT